MAVVKQSVKAKMKNWGDVARKTVTQNNELTTKVVKEAVKAVNEEEKDLKTFIIYGVREDEELEDEFELNEEVMNDLRCS